jgi:5-methylcytosine-specific restriction endonuclease McrA
MERALVLNASDEPLGITGARRAAILTMSQKADVLVSSDQVLHSPTRSIIAPSVIRLRNYVHVPYRRPGGAPSLAGLRARDGSWCAYCTKHPGATIDHVIPRSKGGTHTWDNTVASCSKCNARKSNRTPKEAGMVLHVTPFIPQSMIWLTLAMAEPNPSWVPFLKGMTLDLPSRARELSPV